MIYEYIITAFKVIVGVITHNRLALASLIALGVMVMWVFFSLVFSFQARFSGRVKKINNYVSRNGFSEDAKPGLYQLIKKMPYEFKRGFKKFENNPSSLPSDNIKRFESLDMELSGGVFNQNKSVIKTYINFIFVTLSILSLAILSTEDALTGYMLAEALVIPLLFLITAKLVYYVYTAIRQYQYRCAVDEFNYMLDNLDKVAQNNYADPKAVNMGFGNASNEVIKTEPQYEPVVERVVIEPVYEEEKAVDSVYEDAFVVEDVSVEDNLNNEPVVTESIEEVASEIEPEIKEETDNLSEEFVEEVKDYTEEKQEAVETHEEQSDFSSKFKEDFKHLNTSEVEENNIETIEDKNVSETTEEIKEEPEKEEETVEEKQYSDNFNPDFESLLDEEEEEVKPKRGRGRPKKEVSSTGELVINNDKEFEEALVRAEKLMRKNEEPLSASQTKRIEKQLKELVDAMSKYKEGK